MLMHQGTTTLHTPRLLLRRFTIEDVQAVYNSYTSDKLVSMYHNVDAHESVEKTKVMLAEWITKYSNLSYYHWAIENDGIVIGEVNLFNIADRLPRCELGYTIGSKWWSKGFATEAVAEIIRFAFDEVGFHKICAQHDTWNVGSGKVLQKSGMKQEGLFREHNIRKDGTRNDIAFYAIFQREWRLAKA